MKNREDLRQAFRPAVGFVGNDFLKHFANAVVLASDAELAIVAPCAEQIAALYNLQLPFVVNIETEEEKALYAVAVQIEKRGDEFVIVDMRGSQPLYYGNETKAAYQPKMNDPFSTKPRAIARALEIFAGRLALKKPEAVQPTPQAPPTTPPPAAPAPAPTPPPVASEPPRATLPPPPPDVTGSTARPTPAPAMAPAPVAAPTARPKTAAQKRAEREAKKNAGQVET